MPPSLPSANDRLASSIPWSVSFWSTAACSIFSSWFSAMSAVPASVILPGAWSPTFAVMSIVFSIALFRSGNFTTPAIDGK